jgi:hypothetical protein
MPNMFSRKYVGLLANCPRLHLPQRSASDFGNYVADSTISLDSPPYVLSKTRIATVEVRVFNAHTSPTRRGFQQSTTDKVTFPERRYQQHFPLTL